MGQLNINHTLIATFFTVRPRFTLNKQALKITMVNYEPVDLVSGLFFNASFSSL